MNGLLNSRRTKTKLYLLKDKYLNTKKIINLVIIIVFLLTLIPLIIYVSVYSGYQSKLIQDAELIPVELESTILITDSTKENFVFLFKEAEKLIESRKIDNIHIYIYQGNDEVKEEFTKMVESSKLIPESRYTIENSERLLNICRSAKNVYNLNKFLILSFEQYSIRANFLCNNNSVYSKAFTPVNSIDVEEPKDELLFVLSEFLSQSFTSE